MEINGISAKIPLNQGNVNVEQIGKFSKSDEVIEKKEIKVDRNELKAAVGVANNVLFKNNTHLKFEIHEKTKEVMVRIIEDETGDVIKEIPPEKMLDMIAKLWEIAGIIVDEKR